MDKAMIKEAVTEALQDYFNTMLEETLQNNQKGGTSDKVAELFGLNRAQKRQLQKELSKARKAQ